MSIWMMAVSYTHLNVLKGKHIAKGVRGIIIPATMAVYKECILRGWTTAFIDAGCIVSTPTCGPCLGGYILYI